MTTVEYEVQATDIAAFRVHAFKHLGRVPLGGAVSLVILGLLSGVATFGLSAAGGFQLAAYVAGLATPIAWVLVVVMINKAGTRPDDRGLALGRKRLTPRDGGLEIVGERSEAIIKWSAFSRVIVADKHIFLMIGKGEGIVVPRRAFAADEDEDDFLHEVESRTPPDEE